MQRVDLFLAAALLALAFTFYVVTVNQPQLPKQCLLELTGVGVHVEGCDLSPELVNSIASLARSFTYNSHALDPEDAAFDIDKLCA
ncbi:putative TGB3 [wheat yellow stunt associated betaflexivirus]|nr:putative TGB3 [wheat yellow stunt associated betaflexivirus]